MKRRTLLKSAAAIATSTLFTLGADANPFTGGNRSSVIQSKMGNSIPRFGDGRDWFLEARYGMFVHWGL